MNTYTPLPKVVTWFTKAGDYSGPCRCGNTVHYHIGRVKNSCGKDYKPFGHVTCRKCGTLSSGAIYPASRIELYNRQERQTQ